MDAERPERRLRHLLGRIEPAIDHLGFQVESDDESATIAGRPNAAWQTVVKQQNATCCYARGNKGLGTDPNGVSSETFHTFGESTVYGDDIVAKQKPASLKAAETCCAPAPTVTGGCC